MSSSDDGAAAKAWRNRNSDFQNSWDDTGWSTDPTHAPPGIEEVPYDADSAAFAGLIFSVGRITPDESGYQAEAIRHTHIWDPTLEDPDA